MKVSWAAPVTVWVLSAVAGALIVALADRADRPGLLSLALAGAVVLSFCIQLAIADRKGFTTRLTVSTVGAFAVLALASLAALAVP
jgi:hypothetical protein